MTLAVAPPLADRTAAASALLAEAAAYAPAVLATSFSAEDMVLTDLIAAARLPVGLVTLDTGMLHAETVAMITRTEALYGLSVAVFRPDPQRIADYVSAHGRYAFYESLELRKACCALRKVDPLDRALAGKGAWITGQRRDQGLTRAALPVREHDAARGIPKFNPLADWSWDEVRAYADAHDVPVNPLHARGYPSIGCEPCTRAVRPGEDPRAGRWWWEQWDSKECGLHVAAG